MFDLGYPATDYESDRLGYRGCSLQRFREMFPDGEACLKHVFRTRFGAEPVCPKCGPSSRWYRIAGTKRFQHPCGTALHPLATTIFAQSQIPLQLWFYAMLHFSNSTFGVPASFWERQLGLSQKAAYRLGDRLRLHLAALDAEKKVGAPGLCVEIRIEELSGVRTRGYPSRGVARAVIIGDGHDVQTTLIGRARRHTLRAVIADKLVPDAVPVTTCEYTHRVLTEFGTRPTDVSLVPQLPMPGSRGNPITGFLTYFRRPMRNVYRRVDYRNLWKYLKEFEFRFNRRSRSHETFPDMVGAFPLLSSERSSELEFWSSRFAPQERLGE